MHKMRLPLALGLALLAATPLWADDVCSPEERRAGDAALSRAQAAENSGDLVTALKLANSYEVKGCGDQKTSEALVRRVNEKLGRKAEADGDLKAAFNYFNAGGFPDDARRVGLKQLAAAPGNFQLSSDLMSFMQENGFAEGVAAVRENARQQAQELLSEEERTFAVRNPQKDLLEKAQKWLQLAGEPVAPVEARALQRADGYLALDYAFALQQAMEYYELAGRADKIEAVRAKARRLADQLAGGENWAAAVELYQIAGDSERADELVVRREASAAETEAARKEEFQKEQDDLEKELDF